jgi:DNA-binding NtrC family response regulator
MAAAWRAAPSLQRKRADDERPVKKRILLIDDEESILRVMATFLRRRGYAVECARDGLGARAALDRATYDVVVTDLCLSPGNPQEGLALIAHVRERHPGTPTILFTGYDTPDIESGVRASGVDRFFRKGQRLDEVARAVDELTAIAAASGGA